MNRRDFLGSLASCSLLPQPLIPSAQQPAADKRRIELERLLARLPECEPFKRWLDQTGELPPDFDSLPSVFYLDELLWGDARRSASAWPARRKEIEKLTEYWLLGSAPPPPGNVAGEVLSKGKEGEHEVWKVLLHFGPNHAAKLNVTLYLPKDPSAPSPVFLCDSPMYRGWAQLAMERGFAFCVHGARDGQDESMAYASLFGNYDWSSFRRRGWSASRVVDWLITLPFVDKNRIYTGGHSRSAKQAMAGAAFDERIAGVIASSPGSGGSMPYRLCDQSFFGESAELLTRRFPDWVHLRVRFFCGREHKLPADSHFIYALLAPRPVLMSTGTEDAVESTWAVEQVYRTIAPLYELLGAPKNLAFRYRPGGHGTDQAAARAYSEFLLSAAGLTGKPPADHFPFIPLHVWDYAEWSRKHPFKSAPTKPDLAPLRGPAQREKLRSQVQSRILWLLGEGPVYKPAPALLGEGESDEQAKILGRMTVKAPRRIQLRFGENINGYLFAPQVGKSLPCVIWLGPFQPPLGFVASGYRSAEITPTALVAAGFAVFAYDHIGTGGRQLERRQFYTRFPDWSLMGKMILDARHAIDAALQTGEVDPQRLYFYGYAMGGMVALLAAALDDRVRAVASVAGFTPWRTNTEDKGMGGLRRLSHLHGWLPRLGHFIGREKDVPVDWDEILSALAPRPILLVAPELDRYARLPDVQLAVKVASRSFSALGAPSALQLETPYEENRLTDAIQRKVIAWLTVQAGQRGSA